MQKKRMQHCLALSLLARRRLRAHLPQHLDEELLGPPRAAAAMSEDAVRLAGRGQERRQLREASLTAPCLPQQGGPRAPALRFPVRSGSGSLHNSSILCRKSCSIDGKAALMSQNHAVGRDQPRTASCMMAPSSTMLARMDLPCKKPR
ncbi:unnamed protein product [Prorocentrum cordatum]|uniref:Uncharacterized protein n=1 Tax=Prorocentrum cordatum TaxID=2364126 RepID=A0ABN9VWS4_9DINO|nr:unnamed protein product [Polarella glacialis]